MVIDHGNGVKSMYAHLQRFETLKDIEIKRGDVIGYVGSTGRAQGNHVHYELRVHGNATFPGYYIQARKRREVKK